MAAKRIDYPKSNIYGQTQGFRHQVRLAKEDAEGGKLRQRESDVRYIVDNQIAGSRLPKRGAVKK